MELILFTCCQGAAIDSRTNSLSLFNLVETISSPTFPAPVPPVTLIAWVERKSDEAEVQEFQTRWLIDNERIADLPVKLDFQGKLRARALVEVAGLVIPNPGLLQVQLRKDRKKLATWRIQVNYIGQPHIADATKGGAPKGKAKKKKRKPSQRKRGK